MKLSLVTPPASEPISLLSLKLHLRLDSGSVSDIIDEIQTIAPGLKTPAIYTGNAVEVLGYNAVVEFAAGTFAAGATADVQIKDSDDNITFDNWSTPFTQVTTDGMLTSAGLAIGSTSKNVANGLFNYFIAGVPYSKPAFGAGTSPATGTADDTILQGKYGAIGFEIGADNTIDVIDAPGNDTGYTTAALALAGLASVSVQAGHVRIGTVTAMRSSGGAFVFGTTSLSAENTTVAYASTAVKCNYATTYEMAYTGTKRYIRAVATVATANCSMGISIIRMGAESCEDDLLNDLIETARGHVEDITRRAILTQEWDYYLDEFPSKNYIKIPFGNIQTVTHLKYTDSDGTLTPMTEGIDYLVENNGDQCGRIVLPYGKTWPSFTEYPSHPIVIRFKAGWTTASLVPSKIRTAIKMLAAKGYENRGEDTIKSSGPSISEDKFYERLLASSCLYDEF